MKKDTVKGVIVPVLIVVVFIAALTGVGAYTAPIIEANGSAAELEPLYEVMPDAAGFEAVTLDTVPDTVQGVYKETSGLGYVVLLSTTKGYTGDPIDLTMAVDAEGKISGIKLTKFSDSKHFGEDYPDTYLGQDSALGGVSLVAGVTYSSKAFKEAVEDGFAVLTENGLVSAGVKSGDQILLELLPQLFPGMANTEGVAQYTERELSGGKLVKALDSVNGIGIAYIALDGENNYLVLVNDSLTACAYDTNGADVTESVNASILDEAKTDAAANIKTAAEKEVKKFAKLTSDDAEITPLELGGVYGTVSGVYSIISGGANYYGVAARPIGYGNLPMALYYVLDESGAIVSMTADEFILMGDYFNAYELDESSYKAGFVGVTGDSFTGDEALISGATISTNAVKTGTADAFAAFSEIQQNGGEG
mgnify:FL=1